ncbi:MAG: GNAT family N-acetyltransferase [Planctomycetota bacterium]
MVIVQSSDFSDSKVSESVALILHQCSSEFIPPLTNRSSTTQKQWSLEEHSVTLNSGGSFPQSYFDKLRTQGLVTAWIENRIVGFLSFQSQFCDDNLTPFCPAIYVTTVCIEPDFRGRGICSKIYDWLLNHIRKNFNTRYLSTRTWSTNTGHIRILQNQGFQECRRLLNDRGAGIDTVYFIRHLSI